MITKKDVIDISNLSKLYLDDAQVETSIKDMSSMVDFVSQINSVEIPSEFSQNEINELSNAFHADEVEKSFPREEILENANGGKDGFFYLEKSK